MMSMAWAPVNLASGAIVGTLAPQVFSTASIPCSSALPRVDSGWSGGSNEVLAIVVDRTPGAIRRELRGRGPDATGSCRRPEIGHAYQLTVLP
jgi:hypothetical protein